MMSIRRLLTRQKVWLYYPHRGLTSALVRRPTPVLRSGATGLAVQTTRTTSTEITPSMDVESNAQGSNTIDIHEGSDSTPHDRHNGSAGASSYSERLRTHQFDTYRLVLTLESTGYSRPQAVALMKCLRTVLVNGTEFAKSYYLSRGDQENVS